MKHRGFSDYGYYNVVGFYDLMQENIRIARHIQSGRLICLDNCIACVWAHPEDIDADKWLNIKYFIDAEYHIRFESAYKYLEEVEYSDIVTAGWDKYIIYTSKKYPPKYINNDKIHNMYWLRDKYDFLNSMVGRVTWNGDYIAFEMEEVYDKNGNCDIIKDHILLDRLILTFGQAVIRSAVVEDHANLVRIGNSIWPQSIELDISDEGSFNTFFENITPINIRNFRAEREDTATLYAQFSNKKTLKFTLSCDEISNIENNRMM
jgi:hypothetical protein